MVVAECISSCTACIVHGVFHVLYFRYLTHTHTHARKPPLAHTTESTLTRMHVSLSEYMCVLLEEEEADGGRRKKEKRHSRLTGKKGRNKTWRRYLREIKQLIQAKRLSETLADPTHRCTPSLVQPATNPHTKRVFESFSKQRSFSATSPYNQPPFSREKCIGVMFSTRNSGTHSLNAESHTWHLIFMDGLPLFKYRTQCAR